MSRMDRILEIHGRSLHFSTRGDSHKGFPEQDSDLVCQAGATWDDINATLEEKGIPLFFPVRLSFIRLPRLTISQLDPGLGATIGGMVATGCSGSRFRHFIFCPNPADIAI